MSYLPPSLPIARYRLSFRITRDLHLPAYAGSTLRGVLGHAFLRLFCTCPNHHARHHADCPYATLFAQPPAVQILPSMQYTPPQAYIIESPFYGKTHFAQGEIYAFQLVLLGTHRSLISLFCQAFQYAFQHGVGKHNGTGELCDVEIESPTGWQSIYTTSHIGISIHQDLVLPQHYPQHVLLEWRTPLRVQQQGKILTVGQIDETALLRNLLRRVASFLKQNTQHPVSWDFNALAQQIHDIDSEKHLYWQDWIRHSNRQKVSMRLGGVLGTWQLKHLSVEWAQLLYLGQWLHIGKETVFGHGGYVLHPLAN